jgi:hypothetical protein
MRGRSIKLRVESLGNEETRAALASVSMLPCDEPLIINGYREPKLLRFFITDSNSTMTVALLRQLFKTSSKPDIM